MTGLYKAPFQGKTRAKRVNFRGFSLQGEEENRLAAAESLNCDCADGRLRGGVGVVPCYNGNGSAVCASLEMEIEGVYFLAINTSGKADSKAWVLVGADGYLYSFQPESGETVQRVYIGTNPSHCAIRVRERWIYHLFTGSEAAYYTLDGAEFLPLASGYIGGGCAAGKRFFIAASHGRIAYSAAFDPTKWEGASHEGGNLYIPSAGGDIVGIASVGAYAYIFAERAVCRLTAKADASTFVIEPIAYTGGMICPRSAIALGERIFFLAEDGAYCACGEEVKRILPAMDIRPLRGGNCRVGRFADTALIEYEDEGGGVKRLAIVADGKDAFFVDCYGRLGGNEYFCENGAVGRYVRGDLEGSYPSAPYFETVWKTLGTEKRKLLKKIRLRGRGSVELFVQGDGVGHGYEVDCEGGEGSVRVCEGGNSFRFRLRPALGSVVEGVTVEYLCFED